MLRVYDNVFAQKISLFSVDHERDVVIPLAAVEEFVRVVTGDEVSLIPQHVKSVCSEISTPIQNWSVLVSAQMRHEIIEQQRARLVGTLESNNHYFSTWLKIRAFLDNLQSFELDAKLLCEAIGEKRARSLNAKGRAFCPNYTTSGTATGRLTITSGPNFLVLPKQARKCILRSLPDSAIYSIDFTSLEPRVSLWTSSKCVQEADIYENVMRMCKIEKRDVAKLATLSALYGAGINRLAGMVENRRMAKDILARVSDYFSVNDLNKRLAAAAESSGVKNHFGRPLHEATKSNRLRVNHYVQSTAAELALLLFSDLCSNFHEVKPLLVIHDALIVEVPNSAKESFIAACNAIEHFGFSFPTKQEILDN